MDDVMLDFKCTLVLEYCEGIHVDLNNRVCHSWRTGTYPCGVSSVIMRSDLLSSHLYRKSSPCFCCALEVLHQVNFLYLHIGVSFWYASKS
jgi:hypothetical protein